MVGIVSPGSMMPGSHFLCLLARPGGKLVTYGPYAKDGVLAPESNQQVDNLSNHEKKIPVMRVFIL